MFATKLFWILTSFTVFIIILAILTLTRAEVDIDVNTVKQNIEQPICVLTNLEQQNYRNDQENNVNGIVLRVVTRDSWLAQQPSKPPLALNMPVSRVIVISTKTEDCTTQAACTFRVRYIQTYNIESQQHGDIIYNFLIGGDGNVYEGRGWDYMGAHLKSDNENSISFAYIGTFRQQKPTAKQLNVTKLLLEDGVRYGKLSQNYRIYSAYDLDPTSIATSAEALYESFKDWPHWNRF